MPETIKDGAYVIKLAEYADVGTLWLLCILEILKLLILTVFGVEHVPKETEKVIGHKNIKENIFRAQSNNSIMYEYFCIGFIDFMLADKTLIDFTSLFSAYDFEKNDDIILSCFKYE